MKSSSKESPEADADVHADTMPPVMAATAARREIFRSVISPGCSGPRPRSRFRHIRRHAEVVPVHEGDNARRLRIMLITSLHSCCSPEHVLAGALS